MCWGRELLPRAQRHPITDLIGAVVARLQYNRNTFTVQKIIKYNSQKRTLNSQKVILRNELPAKDTEALVSFARK